MPDLSPAQAQTFMIVMAIIVAIVILIDMGLFIAWAFRKEDADAGSKPPLFAPQWSLVDVWAGGQIIMVLLLIAAFGAMIVQMLITGISVKAVDPGKMLPFLLITLVAQNVLLFGVPAGTIVLKYRTRLAEIGLPRLPTRQQVGIGIALALALMFVSRLEELGLIFLLKHTLGGQLVKQLEDLTKTSLQTAF